MSISLPLLRGSFPQNLNSRHRGGRKRLLRERQSSQVLLTKNVGVSLSRDETFFLCMDTDPDRHPFCTWVPGRSQEKPRRVLLVKQGPANGEGVALPLSRCPGRCALILVRLSESHLSKFILVSIFIVPPRGSIPCKTLRQTLWKPIVQDEFYEWLPAPALSIWK